VELNVNYTIQQTALRSNRYRFVKSAKATGKYTVEIASWSGRSRRSSSARCGVAGQMVSKKAYEEMGDKTFARNPIGTGPWQLESWKPGEVVITRNMSYFKPDLPNLEKFTFNPVAEAQARRTKLEQGEIDFFGQPDY
jgi:ABC-type transport system substrate-binding protein